MSIDPRLKERRKTVAEEKAQKNVSRLLKFLVFVVVAGAGVWVALSPWLSVSQVSTNGIEASDGYAVLAEHDVVAGTPMITINRSGVEAALIEDPWVAKASVRIEWPNDVVVDVVERVPVAWVETASGWARHDIDGFAVPSAGEPDQSMVHIEMPHLADTDAPTSVDLLGALEFASTLDGDLYHDTVVNLVDGELWASVSGFEIRLGRSVEMAAKALSLGALLKEDIPEGSTLILIAPTHPSHRPPPGDDDGAETGGQDDETREGEGEDDA